MICLYGPLSVCLLVEVFLAPHFQEMEKRQEAWCVLEVAVEKTKDIPLHELEPVCPDDGSRSPLRQAIQDILRVRLC